MTCDSTLAGVDYTGDNEYASICDKYKTKGVVSVTLSILYGMTLLNMLSFSCSCACMLSVFIFFILFFVFYCTACIRLHSLCNKQQTYIFREKLDQFAVRHRLKTQKMNDISPH